MQSFRREGREVHSGTSRRWLPAAGKLEAALLSIDRELHASQNEYLQLGFQASTLAAERDAALAALQRTETYLASTAPGQRSTAAGNAQLDPDEGTHASAKPPVRAVDRKGDGASQPPAHGHGGHPHGSLRLGGPGTLDFLKTCLTPQSRWLQHELRAARREFASLDTAHRELADRVSAIRRERDAALQGLAAARQRAGLYSRVVSVDRQAQARSAPPAADDNAERLSALTATLARTRNEKNDIIIQLAEREDEIARLACQEAELRAELGRLRTRLSDRDKENAAVLRKLQDLENAVQEGQAALAQRDRQLVGLRIVEQQMQAAQRAERLRADSQEQRLAELDSALAAAKRSIEDLELSLAEARYREEVQQKHAATLQGRLEASSRDKPAADTDGLRDNHASAVASAGHEPPEKHNNWTKIAAGLVLLLGLFGSLAKLRDLDHGWSRDAAVSREVAVIAPERQSGEPVQAGREEATPPDTAAPTAALEGGGIQLSGTGQSKSTGTGNGIIPGSRVAVRSDRGRTLRSAGGEPLVRVWLMKKNDADTAYATCLNNTGDADACAFLDSNMLEEGVIRLPGGVQYTVIRNGTGASPGPEDTVLVKFRGMLLDGTEFDSSQRRGGASRFRVDEAIPGLQDVLQYMEEGARWEVYIPADLAFRKPAPFGGQVVVYEIELLSVDTVPPASPAPGGLRTGG